MPTGADIFISYASDIRPMAEELSKALKQQGFNPWVDFEALHAGDRFQEKINDAVQNAESFVIMVGANSRATRLQEAEWTAALARSWADEKKRLLPVVFGSGAVPPFLQSWMALRIDPDREGPSWPQKVVEALRNNSNGAIAADPIGAKTARLQRYDELARAMESSRNAS